MANLGRDRLRRNNPRRLNMFLTYLDSVKGYSTNTIDSYEYDLTTALKYIRYLKGFEAESLEAIPINDIEDDFYKDITLDDLYCYLDFSKHQLENKNSTLSRKVASLKVFFKYLNTKARVITSNPSIELETPKIGKVEPKYLSYEQCLELMSSVDGRNPERDTLILTLFLNCGMRLHELCSIKMNNMSGDTLLITGKGNKQRYVYLNQSCLKALEKYMPIRQKILEKKKPSAKMAEYLLLTERGTNIARRTVQHIVEVQLKNANLRKYGFSTHKLRHTAATLLHQNNVSVLVIKEILGHTNVSTTQIYAHNSSSMIKEAIVNNPLNV